MGRISYGKYREMLEDAKTREELKELGTKYYRLRLAAFEKLLAHKQLGKRDLMFIICETKQESYTDIGERAYKKLLEFDLSHDDLRYMLKKLSDFALNDPGRYLVIKTAVKIFSLKEKLTNEELIDILYHLSHVSEKREAKKLSKKAARLILGRKPDKESLMAVVKYVEPRLRPSTLRTRAWKKLLKFTPTKENAEDLKWHVYLFNLPIPKKTR